MAYATLADITDMHTHELGELCFSRTHQDFITNGTFDESAYDAARDSAIAVRVAEAMIKASSFIDANLSERFKVPLTVVPAQVVLLTVDIAIYYLYGLRQGPPEWRQKRYDDAFGILKRVAANLMNLGPEILEVADRGVSSSGGVSSGSTNSSIFNRRNLRGF